VKSFIVVLFKRGDRLECKNYRPISLLIHIYKHFMTRIIDDLYMIFIPFLQAAYQPGRGTVEQYAKYVFSRCFSPGKMWCVLWKDLTWFSSFSASWQKFDVRKFLTLSPFLGLLSNIDVFCRNFLKILKTFFIFKLLEKNLYALQNYI